jgi:hypothetical protein
VGVFLPTILPPRFLRPTALCFALADYNDEISRRSHPDLQGSSLMSQFKLDLAMYADCFKPGAVKRTHVGVMLMFFQQLCVWRSLSNHV